MPEAAPNENFRNSATDSTRSGHENCAVLYYSLFFRSEVLDLPRKDIVFPVHAASFRRPRPGA